MLEILGIDFPRGLIIEWAYCTLAPHQLAKFLCFTDVSGYQLKGSENTALKV